MNNVSPGQLAFFPESELHAAARQADPETSRDAAESLSEEHLGRLNGLIITRLQTFGGQTCSEIAEAIDFPRDSVSPRMKFLVKNGFVVNSGEKRAGPSGRAQIIWEIR